MTDVLQIIGAVLILTGFAASQLGWMGAKSITYLVLNIVGAALLTWLALHDGDWGFFLLEGVWTVVSLIALGGVLLGRRGRVTTATPSPERRSPQAAAGSPESPPRRRLPPPTAGLRDRRGAHLIAEMITPKIATIMSSASLKAADHDLQVMIGARGGRGGPRGLRRRALP